ncbi:MAG: hypothetical protein K6A38_08620 [Lachnospiraceae bacterium]|nr:hypothetical protein [Lachnospiraceae bacterium]
MPRILSGIIFISVFVEFYSIIGKIGIIPHLIVLLLSGAGFYLLRDNVKSLIKAHKNTVISWEGFFWLIFVLLIAFYASRGEFHTDTKIYHAATIRMYEEYGLIKGMGNLQLHYAYNSSYLAFASLFSMRWLFGDSPLHVTTAFLEICGCIYSFYGLKRFKEHKHHASDTMRVAILFYVLIIIVLSMSPATDFATMLIALFIISMWCDAINCEDEGKRTIKEALLSVAAVYTLTMKFSSCFMVLLVIAPLLRLIKKRDISSILKYLLLGIVVAVPFLLRNYLISGWLLYPFAGIDIFNVEWKVPLEYLQHDQAQITVYGRCLFDVEKLNLPLREWFPVWLEARQRYEMMLMLGTALGTVFLLYYVLCYVIRKKEYALDYIAVFIASVSSLALWFLAAPFIRYALAFILAVMMIPLGCYLSDRGRGFIAIVTGFAAFGIFACLTPYFDNYIKDAGSFVKQNYDEPYYVSQRKYEDSKTGQVEINGNTIYYCDEGENNSYYYCPNTCYYTMLERTELIGDSLKDGFKAK